MKRTHVRDHEGSRAEAREQGRGPGSGLYTGCLASDAALRCCPRPSTASGRSVGLLTSPDELLMPVRRPLPVARCSEAPMLRTRVAWGWRHRMQLTPPPPPQRPESHRAQVLKPRHRGGGPPGAVGMSPTPDAPPIDLTGSGAFANGATRDDAGDVGCLVAPGGNVQGI